MTAMVGALVLAVAGVIPVLGGILLSYGLAFFGTGAAILPSFPGDSAAVRRTLRMKNRFRTGATPE